MNTAEFDELAGLYLDKELSHSEFKMLQAEIMARPELQRRFDEACRYRYAEKVAFAPQDRKIIARDIALLRSRMVSNHGSSAKIGRNRRIRPTPQRIPLASAAAMTVALIGLIALGQGVLNGPLGKIGFYQEIKPAENLVVNNPTVPRINRASSDPALIDERRKDDHWFSSNRSLASSLRLSGLSQRDSSSVAEGQFEAALFQESAEERTPRRRIVLVVPRSALPYREDMREVKVRATSMQGENKNHVLAERIPEGTVLTGFRQSY